jgi:TP901-1 family phage major tail protein
MKKRTFDLQKFADAVQGRRILYKYRLKEKAGTEAAWMLAFVTENENDITVDADSTATKDGTIRTPSVPEIEHTVTSILSKSDERAYDIKNAMLANKLFEYWEINLDMPGTDTNEGKYKGTYYQGYCTEWDLSSNAEDMAELSLTFGANGSGADGWCTVTNAEAEAATYVFQDTTAAGA